MLQNLSAPPNLTDVLNAFREDIFSSFNCMKIGVIESFDASTQTCSVSVATNRAVEKRDSTTKRIKYPIITHVPILKLSGGEGGIEFPISSGDNCLLFFCDNDIDNWFVSGSGYDLNSDRKHNISDCFALVGPTRGDLTGYLTNAVRMFYDETQIKLDSKIQIKNSSASLRDILNDSLQSVITSLNALASDATLSSSTKTVMAAQATALTATKTALNLLMES